MLKKIIYFGILTGLLTTSCNHSWKVASPDGNISVQINEDNNNHVVYSVLVDDKTIILPSRLGIALRSKEQDFTNHLSFLGNSVKEINETYKMKTGKKSECINHANELTLSFKNKSDQKIDLVFRACNDGIAFRYQMHNTIKDTVKEEISCFAFDSSTLSWCLEYRSDYEGFYPLRNLDSVNKNQYVCPALFKTRNNIWLLASDAAVYGNYAAAHITQTGKNRMRFSIPNDIQYASPWYPESYEEVVMNEDTLIEAQPDLTTPWRAFIIGTGLSKIVESTLIENLNPPCELKDTSWIKPGIACFPWWSDDCANDKPERLKKFIDMAAEMGWQYIEFDIGLLGNNGGYAKNYWRTIPYIPEIINYAAGKGISVFGWDERRNLNTPEKRADIFDQYKKWGVSGIKIDFLNSDKQDANAFREEATRDAAKYKLLVSFHGENSPKGMRRRFPNLMTQEGVRGEEYYKFAPDKDIPTPAHNCTLPFTRNVVGPMDYTPVGFSTPRRKTTYCHELALPIIFESGWTCVSDKPEEILTSPAKDLMKKYSATWDDIHFIDGYPGEYVCLARRKGNDWYVACINSGPERSSVLINFNFLKPEKYKVELYRDFYSWEKNPDHKNLKCDTIVIPQDATIRFPVAANGGFAFIIKNSYK